MRIARLTTVTAVGALLATTLCTAAAAPAGADDPRSPKIPGTSGGKGLGPGGTISSNDSANTLTSNGLQNGSMTRGQFGLTVQTDGNLVEYDTTRVPAVPVWQTGTSGAATPVRLTLQTDGNVVLYDANSKPLWSTGTAGQPVQYFDVYGNGQIVTQAAAGGSASGRFLSVTGPAVTPLPGFVVAESQTGNSTSSHYVVVQDDGNVVEYRIKFNGGSGGTATPSIIDVAPVWSTGTSGKGQVRLVAQSDGNLVVYQVATGKAVWQSGTHGPTGYYQFDSQNDGNVVLYSTDGVNRTGAVWASGTFG